MKKLMRTTAALSLLTLAALPVSAADEEKKFKGLYLGADAGLDEDGNFLYNGHLGARLQTDNGLVYGVEGKFGTFDVNGFDNFWSVTGQAGFAFGQDRKNLFYGGIGYSEFKDGLTFRSEHYQVGYERALTDHVNFRLQATLTPFMQEDIYQFTSGLSLKF